mmetsp:Transcript_33757/g.70978  ORF Transcript_33757/g.70978 Transcript_33757/m.70978 type:complete len:93 (-) Transcript_33757:84-362(-)
MIYGLMKKLKEQLMQIMPYPKALPFEVCLQQQSNVRKSILPKSTKRVPKVKFLHVDHGSNSKTQLPISTRSPFTAFSLSSMTKDPFYSGQSI